MKDVRTVQHRVCVESSSSMMSSGTFIEQGGPEGTGYNDAYEEWSGQKRSTYGVRQELMVLSMKTGIQGIFFHVDTFIL